MLAEVAAAIMGLVIGQGNAARINAAEQRHFDAVSALADGFVLYDADNRLVTCDDAYREFDAERADLPLPGMSLEGIVRTGVLCRRRFFRLALPNAATVSRRRRTMSP